MQWVRLIAQVRVGCGCSQHAQLPHADRRLRPAQLAAHPYRRTGRPCNTKDAFIYLFILQNIGVCACVCVRVRACILGVQCALSVLAPSQFRTGLHIARYNVNSSRAKTTSGAGIFVAGEGAVWNHQKQERLQETSRQKQAGEAVWDATEQWRYVSIYSELLAYLIVTNRVGRYFTQNKKYCFCFNLFLTIYLRIRCW